MRIQKANAAGRSGSLVSGLPDAVFRRNVYSFDDPHPDLFVILYMQDWYEFRSNWARSTREVFLVVPEFGIEG